MAASSTEVTKTMAKTDQNTAVGPKTKFHRYPSSSSVSNIGQMPVEFADWEPVTSIGFKEKFKKKATENPFVPIGIFATTCALTVGLLSFRKGQVHRSQMMMRARVAAQAFTIGAVLVGVFLQTKKSDKKELKKP